MGKVGAPVDRIRLPATKGSYRYRSSSDAETLSSGIFTRRMLRSGRGLHVGLLRVRSCDVTLPIVAILIGSNDEKYSFPHSRQLEQEAQLPVRSFPPSANGPLSFYKVRNHSFTMFLSGPPSPTGLSPRMVHGVNAR